MRFAAILLPLIAASCATLPNPYEIPTSRTDDKAAAVLNASASAHGDPWERYRTVKVSFEGEWGKLATIIQPELTDSQFRGSSTETYRPGENAVLQKHTGRAGTKTVSRGRGSISVSYNGEPTGDSGKLNAAALVTDAYTVFLFGPSWLAANGDNLHLLPGQSLGGEACHLVSGTVRPGFGRSDSDNFIVWISEKTNLLKRFQFTLNGLESTQGADVEVTFSRMRTAPDGSIWPTHFLEKVQRPIRVHAHEWHTTSLFLDGKKAF